MVRPRVETPYVPLIVAEGCYKLMTTRPDRPIDPGLARSDLEVKSRQSSQATEGRESMPWFIVQSERKTWTRYVVQADSAEAATDDSNDWQYFGYVDGEDTESKVIGGPFESREEALDDDEAYVDAYLDFRPQPRAAKEPVQDHAG